MPHVLYICILGITGVNIVRSSWIRLHGKYILIKVSNDLTPDDSMQHRHHLDISRSLCLHSSRQEVRKVENHPYLSRIQHVYLNETTSKNRSMWKEDL